MSEVRSYVIRRAFVFPLGLLLLLCLVLLVIVVMQHQPIAKAFILAGMMVPLLLVFLESLVRRVELDEVELRMRKLLRSKTLPLAAITALESVLVRKRAYLSLSAGDDFLLVSNAYGGFAELLRTLVARLPNDVISEEARAMAEAPPVKQSDVVMAWLGVALMVYLIAAQF